MKKTLAAAAIVLTAAPMSGSGLRDTAGRHRREYGGVPA